MPAARPSFARRVSQTATAVVIRRPVTSARTASSSLQTKSRVTRSAFLAFMRTAQASRAELASRA